MIINVRIGIRFEGADSKLIAPEDKKKFETQENLRYSAMSSVMREANVSEKTFEYYEGTGESSYGAMRDLEDKLNAAGFAPYELHIV